MKLLLDYIMKCEAIFIFLYCFEEISFISFSLYKKMAELDKLIEINTVEKPIRRSRLEDN